VVTRLPGGLTAGTTVTDAAIKAMPTGASPTFYLAVLPGLIQVARDHGYCLAVHGSLARDLDLVAVPWTETATGADELIRAICNHTGGYFRRNAEVRAHRRRCFSIYLGGGPYLDISVTPREQDAGHHETHEPIHEDTTE